MVSRLSGLRFRRNPSLAAIGRTVGLSASRLHAEFCRCFGRSPKRLAMELQVAEAQRLLLSGVPVAEVCARVGLCDRHHLDRRFGLLVGRTAGRWLAEQHGPAAEAELARRAAAAHRYVGERFQQPPSLAELVRVSGLSRYELCRQFELRYGTTPRGLADAMRLAEAQRLMLAGVPLGEVYRRVGFSAQTHLSAWFRRETGRRPLAWLRERGVRRWRRGLVGHGDGSRS